ncbi:DUF167 domain-containing protein [Phaeobacter sp. HF9A]|nr:DUF167 domain-containing protein [Phaeobacter sp. HF9A]
MAKPKARKMADLSDLAQPGAEITARVTPKAAFNAVLRDGEVIKVLVTTVPEGGKATADVQALLAKALGIAPSALELRRGATSRDKTFVILDRGRRQALATLGKAICRLAVLFQHPPIDAFG